MDIVFNVNPLGLEGLGATLSSLVRNCSNSQKLKLWFLCTELRKQDKEKISELLKSEKFNGLLEYIDFDAKGIFGHLRSLHGDWTTYGRLLISNYVKGDTALYLDSDLIILLDVLTLEDTDFEDHILAAAYGSPVACTLDRDFFLNKLKCSPDQKYFNAGVILFNLKKWRDLNIASKWKQLAEKYPNDLISHDQTLLNAISEGNFAHLPPHFNSAWFPGSKRPTDADHAIIHFVGSPKPWDHFGRMAHRGYSIWSHFDTVIWRKEYGKLTLLKIRRTWKIKKSILKLLRNNFFKN